MNELVDQINDLKEKYNECLRVLSRTQEELLVVRKKQPHHRSMKRANTIISSNIICDDDDDDIVSNNEEYLMNQVVQNSALMNNRVRCEPNIPSNSNSLATEVFCTIAKDYRSKNNNL